MPELTTNLVNDIIQISLAWC